MRWKIEAYFFSWGEEEITQYTAGSCEGDY